MRRSSIMTVCITSLAVACGDSTELVEPSQPALAVTGAYETTTNDGSVYLGRHRYLVIQSALTWHEAVAHCESMGAHLVTINSADENAFIWELLPWGWMGASDDECEGDWRWVTDEPFSYTNWASGEPNNCCPPEYCGGDECTPEHYLTFWGEPYPEQWNDVPDGGHRFVCEWDFGAIDIDIKPGSDPNSINLGSQGVVPVAILTTSIAAGDAEDFDATLVEPNTVVFGPRNAPPAHDVGGAPGLHLQDADDDGDIDLVLHFDTEAIGLEGEDTEACISGRLSTGQAFIGCDAVRVLKEAKHQFTIHGRLVSITLFINHADCRSLPGEFEVRLNGAYVGSAASTVGCACNSDELEITLSGPAVEVAWKPSGDNTITVELVDDLVAVGYIRATVETKSKVVTVPVFDATGGDASNRDICLGYWWGPEVFEITLE